MKVNTNMGTIDRIIRSILAVSMITLYLTQTVSGILGVALIVLSIVFFLTSSISFCPLYLPFHISTKNKK